MFPPSLCNNKSAIENGQKSQKRLPGGCRPVRYKEIDNKLMAWFREKRDTVVRVIVMGCQILLFLLLLRVVRVCCSCYC
jgi:hypothetical protein